MAKLRLQYTRNIQEVTRLEAEKQRIFSQTGGAQYSSNELLRRIQERDTEIRDLSLKYEEIEHGFLKRESMFKDSNSYMEQIMKEITEVKLSNQTLMLQNSKSQIMASQAKSL